MQDFSDFIVGKTIYTSFQNGFADIEWRVKKLYSSKRTETKIFQIDVYEDGKYLSKTPKSPQNLIKTLISHRKLNPELFKEIFDLYPELFI